MTTWYTYNIVIKFGVITPKQGCTFLLKDINSKSFTPQHCQEHISSNMQYQRTTCTASKSPARTQLFYSTLKIGNITYATRLTINYYGKAKTQNAATKQLHQAHRIPRDIQKRKNIQKGANSWKMVKRLELGAQVLNHPLDSLPSDTW